MAVLLAPGGQVGKEMVDSKDIEDWEKLEDTASIEAAREGQESIRPEILGSTKSICAASFAVLSHCSRCDRAKGGTDALVSRASVSPAGRSGGRSSAGHR